MSATAPRATADVLTIDDIMLDLEAGRSTYAPPRPSPDHLLSLRSRRRPTLGGRRMIALFAAANALGWLHPRLAAPALERLWFTTWSHPSTRRPVRDLPDSAVPWTLRVPGGRRLHGFAAGAADGRRVVLVHGWAGRAADWRHLAGRLAADGWRVVVPDLPAHGATAGTRTDLYELADAVSAVLAQEDPEAVVAHSLGFPMLLLAIENGAMQPSTVVALAPGRRMAHALATFASQSRLRPALAAELRRAIERRFGTDVFDLLDVDRITPALTATGLVIHDVDDEDVSIEDGRAVAADWPGARFIATEGLGHRRILRNAAVHDLVADELRR